MEYTFSVFGHPNIRGTHRTTLEFTKDSSLTHRGDCIIGIHSDFNMQQLKKFLKKNKVTITIETQGAKETIAATPNPIFSDNKEMVIRTTEFVSDRTFALHADKAAIGINRGLIKKLKDMKARATVTIEAD